MKYIIEVSEIIETEDKYPSKKSIYEQRVEDINLWAIIRSVNEPSIRSVDIEAILNGGRVQTRSEP